jgi:hypothetical protein
MFSLVKSGFPKKEKKKDRSNMILLVTAYFFVLSCTDTIEKLFLQGHRLLKKISKINVIKRRPKKKKNFFAPVFSFDGAFRVPRFGC